MFYHDNINIPLNVVFMGTPEIAAESLRSMMRLAEAGIIDLKCIYTKPPARSAKKKSVIKSPVHVIADELGIRVKTSKTLRNNTEEIAFLQSLHIDLIIVVAFGVILPVDILDIPRYGVLNMHPSLLPDLRGPSPIHYAILKKVKYSGVSIMALDSGVDSGPVIAQNMVRVGKNEYYETLYENVSQLGADLLSEVIRNIFKIRSHVFKYAYPQSLFEISNRTESKLINSDMYRIDFFLDEPLEIYLKVRAFRKSGGVVFTFNGKHIKLLEAGLIINKEEFAASDSCNRDNIGSINKKGNLDIYGGRNGYYGYNDYMENDSDEVLMLIKNFSSLPDASNVPCTVISAGKYGLIIKTAKRGVYLNLLRLQPEGKKPMSCIDFINGHRIKTGVKLK